MTTARRLDGIDTALIVLFLIGLYLGVSLQITSKIPLTCAPSGVAGMAMLWRRRDSIRPAHLAGLFAVVALYLGSVLAASDVSFLSKRFTGLIQLTYSLVIGYAMFLTLIDAERDQVAKILLIFCLCIIVGCLLENHTGLRAISDAVRDRLYAAGVVYDADRRDEILYGRIRPKLFTSEPSAVTFAYTHYCSAWLIISRSRYKLAIYAGLVGLALVMLPGPTLVLMLLLAVPYLVLLAGARAGRPQITRMIGAAALSSVVLGV
ncbi:MAG: hypothetical protein JSR47_19580, partial [Proteobacteria bacterium]|nr:hypothetical protein [Pseudomonadota bacterium]